MPAVLMKMPSALPRSTTLRSPVTMRTPALRAASRIDATIRPSKAVSSPSSSTKPALRQVGRAPHMARSLTVPLIASRPMSPPGNTSGLTTYVSVVKAIGPDNSSRAPSCRRESSGPSKAGRKIVSSRRSVARPPPPWATWMVSSPASGTGHAKSPFGIGDLFCRHGGFGAAVAVIGGAGSLGRNHGDAQGMLRRAALAEGSAIGGPLLAAKDQPADAFAGTFLAQSNRAEALLGIEGAVGVRQRQSALGDLTDAAPAPRDDPKDLAHEVLRRLVARTLHRARILVLDLRPALLQLANAEIDTLEDVERLEASDHDRDMIADRNREIFLKSHHRADVACS